MSRFETLIFITITTLLIAMSSGATVPNDIVEKDDNLDTVPVLPVNFDEMKSLLSPEEFNGWEALLEDGAAVPTTLKIREVDENFNFIENAPWMRAVDLDTRTSRLQSRMVTTNRDYCVGRTAPHTGDFYPYDAVCVFNNGPSYRVYCRSDDDDGGSQVVILSEICPKTFVCKQYDDAVRWTGRLGTDIECVPSSRLIKWAIGGYGQTGTSARQYCSQGGKYNFGTLSHLFTFNQMFYNNVGQQTRMANAKIIKNSGGTTSILKEHDQVNELGVAASILPGDVIQFCGTRGSLALIEGYGTASYIK